MKKFVKASSHFSESSASHNTGISCVTSAKIGDCINEFYTNLCSDHDNKINENSDDCDVSIVDVIYKRKKKKYSCSDEKKKKYSCSDDRVLNRSMKFAEDDDVSNLKVLIEEGLSVNATDIYGWSLLMVASFAGSENVVKYLISKGARKGKRDSKGNTAIYLASRNNHTNIVQLLINSNKVFHIKEGNNNDGSTSPQLISDTSASYFCEVCNIHPSCSVAKHESSISHIFNLGKCHIKPYYGIPKNNIGYQMLLQQGWNDSEGLGPEGTGRKYPVKSEKKIGRHGIGLKMKIGSTKTQNLSKILDNSSQWKTLKHLEKLKEKKFRQLLNEPEI